SARLRAGGHGGPVPGHASLRHGRDARRDLARPRSHRRHAKPYLGTGNGTMTWIEGAEFMRPADLLDRQQEAWLRQSGYVAQRSRFYAALWQGKAPPAALAEIPGLPLSDKAGLRRSQAG